MADFVFEGSLNYVNFLINVKLVPAVNVNFNKLTGS